MGLSWVSHSTLIYTSELILCSTICVHSATRHNIQGDQPGCRFNFIWFLKTWKQTWGIFFIISASLTIKFTLMAKNGGFTSRSQTLKWDHENPRPVPQPEKCMCVGLMFTVSHWVSLFQLLRSDKLKTRWRGLSQYRSSLYVDSPVYADLAGLQFRCLIFSFNPNN